MYHIYFIYIIINFLVTNNDLTCSILKIKKYPHFKGGPDLPPYGGVGVNQVSIR